jgi:hypothetical protein
MDVFIAISGGNVVRITEFENSGTKEIQGIFLILLFKVNIDKNIKALLRTEGNHLLWLKRKIHTAKNIGIA